MFEHRAKGSPFTLADPPSRVGALGVAAPKVYPLVCEGVCPPSGIGFFEHQCH